MLNDYPLVLDVSEYQTPGDVEDAIKNSYGAIVACYIKLAQSTYYINHLASAFAAVCIKKQIPFGYYDYLENHDVNKERSKWLFALEHNVPKADLIPMLDCEGSYDLYEDGVKAFKQGGKAVIYSSYSEAYHYTQEELRWVASYGNAPIEERAYLDEGEILTMKNAGYTLWQFTQTYHGKNLDCSVLLKPIEVLKA